MNDVIRFVAHKHHVLARPRARWLTGQYNEELEVKDVSWINTDGEEMRQDQWDDRNTRVFGMLQINRAAEHSDCCTRDA